VRCQQVALQADITTIKITSTDFVFVAEERITKKCAILTVPAHKRAGRKIGVPGNISHEDEVILAPIVVEFGMFADQIRPWDDIVI